MASIKQTEQKHLDQVVKRIKVAELKTFQVIKHDEQAERMMQKDFYNDVRLRSTTYSGLMETGVEVRQKQQVLSQLNSQWHRSQHDLKRLHYLEKKPYFARVDFISQPRGTRHSIYIGLASFSVKNHYLIYRE